MYCTCYTNIMHMLYIHIYYMLPVKSTNKCYSHKNVLMSNYCLIKETIILKRLKL